MFIKSSGEELAFKTEQSSASLFLLPPSCVNPHKLHNLSARRKKQVLIYRAYIFPHSVLTVLYRLGVGKDIPRYAHSYAYRGSARSFS